MRDYKKKKTSQECRDSEYVDENINRITYCLQITPNRTIMLQVFAVATAEGPWKTKTLIFPGELTVFIFLNSIILSNLPCLKFALFSCFIFFCLFIFASLIPVLEREKEHIRVCVQFRRTPSKIKGNTPYWWVCLRFLMHQGWLGCI